MNHPENDNNKKPDFIRLNKALKEFWFSIDFAVSILEKAGFKPEKTPNYKASYEEYIILQEVFFELEKQRKKEKIEQEKINKLIERKKKERIEENEKLKHETLGITNNHVLNNILKEKGKPNIVYKYMSSTYILETLEQHYLFFNQFKQFNDPFDCNLKLFKFNRPYVKGKKYYRLKERENEYEKTLNKFRICCFSRNFQNILMWGHYAESHKGVCLGFRTKAQGIDPKDVFYTDKFVKANFYPDGKEHILHLFNTKAQNWNYEEEMRMVIHNIPNDGKYHFNHEDLVEIYFGVNIRSSLKKEIIKLLNKNFPNVKKFQAQLSDNSFNLKFKLD